MRSWPNDDWGPGVNVRRAGVGAVTYAVDLTLRLFDFFDRIPYLLVRLREPGVRDKARDQFGSAPVVTRHRGSVHVLGPESTFEEDAGAMQPDGTCASEELGREIDIIGMLNFNDSISACPNVAAHKLYEAASSSNLAWICSTMRHSACLASYEEIVMKTGADIEIEWKRWTSMLQAGIGRRLDRQSVSNRMNLGNGSMK